MLSILPNTPITLTVPFTDMDGLAITPVALSYTLLAEDETALIADEPLTIPESDHSIAVTIIAELNTLDERSQRTLHTLRLKMTVADGGEFFHDESYLIQRAETLRFGVNSFQTFAQAQLTSMDLSTTEMWRSLPRMEQIRALEEAYIRICKLNFRVTGEVNQSSLHWSGGGVVQFEGFLTDLTPVELQSLDTRFLLALRRAQLVEADTILGGDPTAERRRAGLMSETIGESSNMFRSGKPVILPVSARALRYLSGYISFSMSIGRGR